MSAPGSFAVPHGSISQNILLDSSIRDWVVLPLLIIMILAGLLRHYLSLVLKSSSVKNLPKIEQRVKSTLTRSSRLRSGAGGYLSKQKYEARIRYWTDDTTGYLKEEMQWVEEETQRQQEEKEKGAGDNGDDDMPDPMAMMGPMKGQFAFMIQNMVLMQGIGFFFSGRCLLQSKFLNLLSFFGTNRIITRRICIGQSSYPTHKWFQNDVSEGVGPKNFGDFVCIVSILVFPCYVWTQSIFQTCYRRRWKCTETAHGSSYGTKSTWKYFFSWRATEKV